MGGNLPWNLVLTGVFLAIALEVLSIPVMPFAIGLYLPIYLNNDSCYTFGNIDEDSFSECKYNDPDADYEVPDDEVDFEEE